MAQDTQPAQSASSLQAGQKVPAFELAAEGGQPISSKSLKGAPFVIYFYPKDDTSGCTKEAIDFSALKPEFDKIGVQVIGVSRDSVASHGKFRTKHKLSVALGADEGGKVTEAFGVWVEKSMYGRKYMGIERATFLVDATGKIVHVWRKVKVPGHAAEVLVNAQKLKS
jgi:peroxiredoxin Q/BCP